MDPTLHITDAQTGASSDTSHVFRCTVLPRILVKKHRIHRNLVACQIMK